MTLDHKWNPELLLVAIIAILDLKCPIESAVKNLEFLSINCETFLMQPKLGNSFIIHGA